MSQLRQDPLSKAWVVVAEERGQRPIHLAASQSRPMPGRCPFCGGHESDTPPSLREYPASGPWQVRIVPNKYPALKRRSTHPPTADEQHPLHDAYGEHEVVIEGRDHVEEFADLPNRVATTAFVAYRDRLLDLAADPRLAYAQVFKNNGAAAGASIPHVHSQILATACVPPGVAQELQAAEQWTRQHSACYFCRLLEQESQVDQRFVAQTARFVAFCPFTSRFPYETWILPRQHASSYEAASTDDLAELADLVQRLLTRLRQLHSDVTYNYFLHTAPLRSSPLAHYHWHWELLPRITTTAGFEWSTGIFINPLPPESAARRLRLT